MSSHPPPPPNLDAHGHNTPELHVFGGALIAPLPPPALGSVAFAGVSPGPARADHQHGMFVLSPAGNIPIDLKSGSVQQYFIMGKAGAVTAGGAGVAGPYAFGATFPTACDGVVISNEANTYPPAIGQALTPGITATGFNVTWTDTRTNVAVPNGNTMVVWFFAWGH